MSAPSSASPSELDLRSPVRRVWRRRGTVLALTLAAGVLGVLLAMVLPKWYKATAVILPPEETDLGSNLGVMARALSKLPALGEFGEYSTPIDIYKAILASRTVQNEVIDRFGLMRIYRLRSREKTQKALARHTTIKMQPDGTISVSVEDRDPRRAAAMALTMLEGLDRYNISKRNTQGRRTRVFLQQRVAETDSSLRASELALRRYQESHHAVAPTSVNSGDVTAAADLMARKIALEVRIGVMRSYLSPGSEQLVQAQRELVELQRQIGTLPGLQTELSRLIRDNKVQEQLYLLLTAELEDARVKELRDTPTVSILDPPTPPERPSRPRKFYFGLAAMALAFAGACFEIGRREPVAVTRPD